MSLHCPLTGAADPWLLLVQPLTAITLERKFTYILEHYQQPRKARKNKIRVQSECTVRIIRPAFSLNLTCIQQDARINSLWYRQRIFFFIVHMNEHIEKMLY